MEKKMHLSYLGRLVSEVNPAGPGQAGIAVVIVIVITIGWYL
jgi:hypothetical protein